MKRLFFILLLLGTTGLFAQDTLVFRAEHFRPQWMLLRYLQGGKALYLRAADSIPPDGTIRFIFRDQPVGEYALQYDAREPRGLRFIYNGEPVEIAFDRDGNKHARVSHSRENRLYFGFLRQYDSLRRAIKALEKQYAASPRPQLDRRFQQLKTAYYDLFRRYDSLARGTFAVHLIHARKDAFPAHLLPGLDDYLQYDREHYFDFTPMNDSLLYRSNVLTDRLMTYVFKMPVPAYGRERTRAYLERLRRIFDRLNYPLMRAEMLQGFLSVFHKTDRTVEKQLILWYRSLPPAYRQDVFLQNLEKNRIPVKGDVFPTDKIKKLGKWHARTGKKYHLFVFYSSDCPHCQKALPKIYRLLKNRKDIDVTAIGLETDPEHWRKFIAPLNGWQHLMATDEQYNRMVTDYGIEFTPTWFLTDDKWHILETVSGEREILKVLRWFKLAR